MKQSKRDRKHVSASKRRKMSCHNCREEKLKCSFDERGGICSRCSLKGRECGGPAPTQRSLDKRARQEIVTLRTSYASRPAAFQGVPYQGRPKTPIDEHALHLSFVPGFSQSAPHPNGISTDGPLDSADRAVQNKVFGVSQYELRELPGEHSGEGHASPLTRWNPDDASIL